MTSSLMSMSRSSSSSSSSSEEESRAHGIKSRKISISVSEEDLAVLTQRAARAHGGNVSAVVHELVVALKRNEAADQLLDLLDGDRVTEREMQAIRDEIAGPRARPRKRRTAA